MTEKDLLAKEPVGSEIQPMATGDVAACFVAAVCIGDMMAYVLAVACGRSCATDTSDLCDDVLVHIHLLVLVLLLERWFVSIIYEVIR